MKISDDIVYGRTALRDGIPWIVPESFDKLKEIIKPDWKVFEWGAGGSTLYFASQCKFVVSVEHNIQWYNRVNDMLMDRILRSQAHLCLVRGLGDGVENAFTSYAGFIKSYPDNYFDLVYIDGEASSRGWCLTNSITKVKPGGYMLLDNSNWLDRKLDGFEREDFVAKDLTWIGQPGTFDWWTSILRKVQ